MVIIDWGLADYYEPGKRLNVDVFTGQYKPPESIMKFNYYEYSGDIFSLGTMFAALLFRRDPFVKRPYVPTGYQP